MEASCHIELGIYLYLETPEVLQEGFVRREFKLSACHRLTDEQKLGRVLFPLDSRGGLPFHFVGPMEEQTLVSFCRQEFLFPNSQSGLGLTPWRGLSSWRSAAFAPTSTLTLEPGRVKSYSTDKELCTVK